MSSVRGIQVVGEKFGGLFGTQILFSQQEVAKLLDWSEQRITQIKSAEVAGIEPKSFRRLAGIAGVTPHQLLRLIGAKQAPLPAESLADDLSAPLATAEVPTFALSLSAGAWSDVLDVPDAFTADALVGGVRFFRVRLAGDSMEPNYHAGMIVEFECVAWSGGSAGAVIESIEVGRDYYVERDDGAATFKRVERVEGDRIVLRAVNRGKFPGTMAVERSRVVRLALARGEFRPFE